MSDSDFELESPEIKTKDILEIDDSRFSHENVAIVTGAGSGIGRATSIALAINNLTVVGADIDAEGMEETSNKIDELSSGSKFIPVDTDLTSDSDVDELVNIASNKGEIRYVANIAGMQHIASLDNFPMDKYDLMLDLMLRSPFYLSKKTMPHIRETEDGVGAIANMSSVHGHYATQKKAAYITAKHGLHGLTRAIAAEGNGKIRGFSVSVGYVLTPLMVNQIQDTAEERGISEKEVIEDVMLGQARTKEMMTPIEVANLFTFGFSSHGKHLNGADMLWDGGYTKTYE